MRVVYKNIALTLALSQREREFSDEIPKSIHVFNSFFSSLRNRQSVP